jgi:hypothetical protein
MPTRRSFFSAIAFSTAALWPSSIFARQRRRRRRAGRSALSTDNIEPTTFGKFPTGYYYRDRDVELVVPDLTKWSKLQIGMTSKEVRRLLGPPLDDGSADEFQTEIIVDLPDNPDSPSAGELEIVESGGKIFAADRQSRYLSNEAWSYGHLKFLSNDLFWRHFAVSFVEDYLDGFEDPFGGDVSDFGFSNSRNLSHDGRPTVPRLMTPYPNAKFTHEPFVLDFRWLPVCGEYPIEYELEVTAGNDIYRDEIGATKREWHVDPFIDRSRMTHIARLAPGSNPCRWRARAKNRLGTSDWSEYREFQFS